MNTPPALDRPKGRPLGTAVAGLALALPLVFGCARTAPFNQLDKSQVMVLRLQAQEPPAPPPAAAAPAAPMLIPGIPPELQQLGQQALTGLQQVLPPGILPPGLLPGAPQPPAAPPQQPAMPRWKGFIMLAQQPLTDEAVKEEILDIFGDSASFEPARNNCFFPGLGITFQRPGNQPPVDLLVSLSCSQAQGDGFRWPYKVNGFTPETHKRLTQVYEKLWGPVPPGA